MTTTNNSAAGITLVVGSSGSGKSVLLRLLAGQEIPKNGIIQINSIEFCRKEKHVASNSEGLIKKRSKANDAFIGYHYEADEFQKRAVHPVLIDRYYQQEACHTSQTKTVEEYLIQFGRDRVGDLSNDDDDILLLLLSYLAQDFMPLLGISPADATSKPCNLSVSSQFLFRIACACMESVVPTLLSSMHANTRHQGSSSNKIYCPVLLLDELLDFECASVSQRVAIGLHALRLAGAVVVVATHKPYHFTNSNIVEQTITLVGGKVLNDGVYNQHTQMVKVERPVG
jgi:energy-coupling factor transporter ATP-binding protein EcfA2